MKDVKLSHQFPAHSLPYQLSPKVLMISGVILAGYVLEYVLHSCEFSLAIGKFRDRDER